MTRDFTPAAFGRILDALEERRYRIVTVREWARGAADGVAVIRHDVDRRPGNALALARLEAARGVRVTYYFRTTPMAFNARIIREIAAMGHEVGYHYEDLSAADGHQQAARRSFAANLARLATLADVKTVVMHGAPLSRHNNLDFWKFATLDEFGLEADALLTDYARCAYFTDAGRSWRSRANLRDLPPSATFGPATVRSSDDLCAYIRDVGPPRIAINAHPERWDQALPPWCMQWSIDAAANLIKLGLAYAGLRTRVASV
jgi:hypothetical protein